MQESKSGTECEFGMCPLQDCSSDEEIDLTRKSLYFLDSSRLSRPRRVRIVGVPESYFLFSSRNNLVSLFCHPYPSSRITAEQADWRLLFIGPIRGQAHPCFPWHVFWKTGFSGFTEADDYESPLCLDDCPASSATLPEGNQSFQEALDFEKHDCPCQILC
ncbi:hypothetical protein B0H14DRAFT_2575540 [Mycena olivaceomarginata]|nr:hypothetical protein B0H14DRAFT_2575540 [Mycena olivaceomarginata]